MDNMEEPIIWPRSFGKTVLELTVRELILLGATILISVIYKAIIDTGVFGLIRSVTLCQIVFCGLELLLLGVYWHYTYVFSMICRSRTNSMKECYLWTAIVFSVFCAVYWLSYFVMSRELFLWVFRVTVNLIGVRLLTYAPDNLVPYMLIYTAVMFLIMFIEPLVDYLYYKAWMRSMEDE